MVPERKSYHARESFFRHAKATYSRCFAPGVDCSEDAIRAHSVQNAAHLGLLEREGHVVAIGRRYEVAGPRVVFDDVGRNTATTFAGLCSAHDTQLFREIETRPINVQSSEHLFLLAYRAVLRELHAACAAASMIQSSYIERLHAGVEPRNQPTPLAVYATQRMAASYETYLYKSKFDEAFLNGNFQALEHDVLNFQVPPSIAAAALFGLNGTPVGDDIARVCLTVLPVTPEETVAVFSYLRRDATSARAEMNRVLNARGAHQAYELSRVLLNYCENFVIAPAAFDEWTQEKRGAILSLFTRTIFEVDFDVESEHLLLLTPRA
jgi:hypothetical protein